MKSVDPKISDSFREGMSKYGIDFDCEILFNTQHIVRFRCSCDEIGEMSGSYRAFSDENPAGWFKCWRCCPETVIWKYKKQSTSMARKPYQYDTHNNKNSKTNQEQINNAQELAKNEANLIFSKALPCKFHFYLDMKKVKSYGLRVRNNYTLLVPCYNSNGELVNLERIFQDIKTKKTLKRPLKGGQRIGAFFLIGEIINVYETIFICEGYCTAATVHEATDRPTVVSFNCGNLSHVAKIIRKLHPLSKIDIVTDQDERKTGEKHAKSAALIANGAYILPDFASIPSELKPQIERSDFNDLFVLLMERGLNRATALATVRQQITTKL